MHMCNLKSKDDHLETGIVKFFSVHLVLRMSRSFLLERLKRSEEQSGNFLSFRKVA